jgi:hypothetical protein
MTPDFHAHAKQRLISNAYPGWWVRTFKESGTSDEETREGVEITDFSNEYVLCCTKAEAKKAGAM